LRKAVITLFGSTEVTATAARATGKAQSPLTRPAPGADIPAGRQPARRTGRGALPRRIHGQWRRAALLPEIARNALPPGLSIDSTADQITGTPTTAGTFSFRARVTDTDETQFFADSVQLITISG